MMNGKHDVSWENWKKGGSQGKNNESRQCRQSVVTFSGGGKTFDVILLDIMMPGKDGLFLARDLQSIIKMRQGWFYDTIKKMYIQ